ncbi:MAG: type III-A CRISPR-associated RAMP protein Csm3 [Cloacibacillus sp.]
MNGKIKINTTLKVLTGLHIGGNDAFSPIGAVNKPVAEDPRTGKPIIPGSSLKGKLRTLLAAQMQGSQKAAEPNKDCDEIKRLFGASEPKVIRSRLQFADSFVANAVELAAVGLREVKYENSLDRITCAPNPRQIERVISGVEFSVVITYDLPESPQELEEDMKNLATAMRLLQIDYLGGHGSRGSGRVSFKKINFSLVESSLKNEELEPIRAFFKEIEDYELLSL